MLTTHYALLHTQDGCGVLLKIGTDHAKKHLKFPSSRQIWASKA
jgi:hypothetical protein